MLSARAEALSAANGEVSQARDPAILRGAQNDMTDFTGDQSQRPGPQNDMTDFTGEQSASHQTDQTPRIQRFGLILHRQWGQFSNLHVLPDSDKSGMIQQDIIIGGIVLQAG